MSLHLEQGWIQLFKDKIKLDYQQMTSLVRGNIDPEYVAYDRSSRTTWPLMGPAIARERLSPFATTVPMNLARGNRETEPRTFDAVVWLSEEHDIRSLVNSMDAYRRSLVASLIRSTDKLILERAIGPARNKTIDAVTNTEVITYTPLPASQILGTGAQITLQNIIDVSVLLSQAGISTAARRMAYFAPKQLIGILAITQATSSDYTRTYIVEKGTMSGHQWMGFTWQEVADVYDSASNRLVTMLPLSGTTRSCIFMARDAVALQVAKEIETKIDPLPLQSYARQVFCSMAGDAVRISDNGVVQLNVLE